MRIFSTIWHFIKNDRNPETQIKWSLYLRVWRQFGLPWWKWLLLGAVCTVCSAAAEGFAITLVHQMIDVGFIEKNMDVLYLIGIELIAAYLGKSLCTYTSALSMAHAGLSGAASLRRRLYSHMLSLSQDYFQGVQTGPLMNAFTGLSGSMLNMVTGSFIEIIRNISTLCIMVTLMVWYAPQLTLTLVFLIPVIAVTVTLIARLRRAIARRSFDMDSISLSRITESILGIKTIQSFVSEKREYERLSNIEQERYKLGMKGVAVSSLQSPLLELLISFGLCGALIAGGHYITGGSLTTGDFAAFLLALTAAYKPAKSLSNIGSGIQVGLVAAEQLFAFLDRKGSIEDKADALDLNEVPAHGQQDKSAAARGLTLAFEQVCFGYHEQDGDVLHDITLSVPPGSVCAFVGESGGGKSTLFALVERFYDPRLGRVTLNGLDIRDLKLSSLRGNLSWVSQDVFLFDGSIADNIRYGRPDATDEEVRAAAKAANAHDFIEQLGGYNSPVGERGQLLSGGQKQRLAIARAILKNAPILLLDEATSALDSESEQLIQQALDRLMRGRTTLVIAHRLSTILDADQICVISKGRIIERGTDVQLCALGGEYKKLRDLQFDQDQKDERARRAAADPQLRAGTEAPAGAAESAEATELESPEALSTDDLRDEPAD